MEKEQNHQNLLFWENPPLHIDIIEKYQEMNFDNDTLEYFQGKIGLQEICYIRKFTSKTKNIRALAEREISIISKLRGLNIRDNALGYFFIDEETFCSYFLVFKSYPLRLSDMINENTEKKMIIISSLTKLVYKLYSNDIIYLLLSPETIFVDDFDLILGDSFLADTFNTEKKFKTLFKNIKLTKSNFISSLFYKMCRNSVKYDESKIKLAENADFHSLKQIIMFLYEVNTINFPLISENNLDIHYNNIKCCQLFKQTKNLKLIEIISLISTNNLDLQTLYACLDLNEIKLYDALNLNDDLSSINGLKITLKAFQTLQSDIFSYRLNKEIFYSKLKRKSEKILETYSEIFKIAKQNFLQTQCFNDQINISDGIIYFIWVFLTDMKESKILRANFHSSISKQKRKIARNYCKALKIVKFLCPYLQNYYLLSLIAQNYKIDWNYYFCSESFFLRFSRCYALIFCKEIMDIFSLLLKNHKVLQILSKYLDAQLRNKISEIIFDHALPHAYIIQLPPSLHGFTTYSLSIFLSIYDLETTLNPPPRYIAAWFLTLFHELAHFLRRYTSNNFFESKSRFTPKNNLTINFSDLDSDLTENQIEEIGIRGESGNDAENELWEPQDYINDSAAKYFLKGDFESREFMTIIKKKNSKTMKNLALTKKSYPNFCLADKICGVSRR